MQNTWILVKFSVLKEYREHGVGKAIHYELPQNQLARVLYSRLKSRTPRPGAFMKDKAGITSILIFDFEGDQPLVMMSRISPYQTILHSRERFGSSKNVLDCIQREDFDLAIYETLGQ